MINPYKEPETTARKPRSNNWSNATLAASQKSRTPHRDAPPQETCRPQEEKNKRPNDGLQW